MAAQSVAAQSVAAQSVAAQSVLCVLAVVAATALLWRSDHFSRPWASSASVALYLLAALFSSLLADVPAVVVSGSWTAAGAASALALLTVWGRRTRSASPAGTPRTERVDGSGPIGSRLVDPPAETDRGGHR